MVLWGAQWLPELAVVQPIGKWRWAREQSPERRGGSFWLWLPHVTSSAVLLHLSKQNSLTSKPSAVQGGLQRHQHTVNLGQDLGMLQPGVLCLGQTRCLVPLWEFSLLTNSVVFTVCVRGVTKSATHQLTGRAGGLIFRMLPGNLAVGFPLLLMGLTQLNFM